MSAVNPTLLQNLDTRPKKVVLPPTRMADWKTKAHENIRATAARLARDTGLFELMPAPGLVAAELDHPETTTGLRLASLAGDLAAYRYKQIILMLSNPATRREYPPEASCFLGEAYRLRNEAGDEARAEREFKRGDTGETNTRLRQYLALDPTAADRTYVEYYISLMDSPAPADNNLPKAE